MYKNILRENMSKTKSELIDSIMAAKQANKNYPAEKAPIDRLMLEGFSIEQLEKQEKIFSKTAKDVKLNQDGNKMLEGSAVSMGEIKTLLESLVSASFEHQDAQLGKRMLRLIAEGLPIVKLQTPTKEIVNMGMQHKQFKDLLAAASVVTGSGPLNVWLTGPAGSGKTKAAEGVAKALNRKFYFNGAVDTEYKLMGFTDANGKVVRREFREAYENGGIYLFDEVDASLPAALLAFNAALANGYCDFPDKRIDRHPDCVIIAAANTWGTGPNSDYVGRNKLDAAFLDRFVQISWGYDEKLERVLGGHDEWVDYVQAVRQNVLDKKIKAVISPRASISGAALLKSGAFSVQQVIEMTLQKGLNTDNWNAATHGISSAKLQEHHRNYLEEIEAKEALAEQENAGNKKPSKVKV